MSGLQSSINSRVRTLHSKLSALVHTASRRYKEEMNDKEVGGETIHSRFWK